MRLGKYGLLLAIILVAAGLISIKNTPSAAYDNMFSSTVDIEKDRERERDVGDPQETEPLPVSAFIPLIFNDKPNTKLSLGLSQVTVGLDEPVGIVNAGDDRLFVIELDGRVRIIKADGSLVPTPFLDITDRVDASSSEEGLLGIAFHPDYADNGFFFLNYTNTTASIRRTRLSRFSVTGDSSVADPNSEVVLLTVTQPFHNHNAGHIMFGPDGYLYIPLGDGGSGGDPFNYGQDPTILLGKVSRIDVNSGPGVAPDCVGIGTGGYSIPATNPSIDGQGGNCDEIWLSGLRNPWQSSFDRMTGDLYIGDVGQGIWEEIDIEPAGSSGGTNFGWRCYEGNHPYNPAGCGPMEKYTFPIFEYSHSDGNCSVVAGYVYRGAANRVMIGRYFLADYCTGYFWDLNWDGLGGWNATQHTNLATFGFSAFGEAANGELYVANISNGTIYHLEANAAPGTTKSLSP